LAKAGDPERRRNAGSASTVPNGFSEDLEAG
jgi:hypothetical protein